MSPKAKRFAFEDAHALGCIATFSIQEDIEWSQSEINRVNLKLNIGLRGRVKFPIGGIAHERVERHAGISVTLMPTV